MSRLVSERLLTVRSPDGRMSTRLHPRSILVTAVLVSLSFGVFCWSVSVGDHPVPLGDVVAHVFGNGPDGSDFVVRTLRMPRALTAVLVGAAFGLSGAIFQRLAANPLATPDVIGINAGAAVVAVFVIVTWQGTRLEVTAGALVGAVATALATYLLAYRRGVTGYRLVLVGIGIAAVLRSATHYLLTRAEIEDVHRAAVWLTGSLHGRNWDHVRPLTVALAVLVPAAVILSRHLRMLELGDDAARGLGVRVEGVRGGLLLTGTALAAVGTAAAGPIAFVALVSPQVARRLTGGRALGLLPAAACGALLLAGSDLAARRVLAPTELPVGVVTAILGAPYLLYLLARTNTIGRGG